MWPKKSSTMTRNSKINNDNIRKKARKDREKIGSNLLIFFNQSIIKKSSTYQSKFGKEIINHKVKSGKKKIPLSWTKNDVFFLSESFFRLFLPNHHSIRETLEKTYRAQKKHHEKYN